MDPFIDPKYINLDYIFGKIYYFFTHLFNPFSTPGWLDTTIKFLFAAFSMFFLFVIAYSFVRLLEIRKKEHEHLHHELHEYKHKHADDERNKLSKTASTNERWDAVLQYLYSMNASDWKLAILEADSMLESLMDQLGFKGENLGEKLKNADQEKFKNLSTAWEVHIIRNKIAHETGDYTLSHHEAKRVIALYEQIFRVYGYI